LFNVHADVSERRNQFEERPEVVRELTTLLDQYKRNGRSTSGEPQQNDVEVQKVRSAGAASETTPAKEFLPPLPAGKEWKLIWQDEFDGPTLDEAKWNRLGDSKRRDGYWVKEDAYERYTCGAVNTRGKFEHAFGYYVARCKMPKQPGHWPAFWMMCDGVGRVGDQGRDGTEIDIMEMPWRDGKINMGLHWDGYAKEHQSVATNFTITALTEGFHDYALLWTPEEYVIYVDGQEVWRTHAGGVSQVPEYLKLTEEIGDWGGDIAKAQLPDYFEVDYVRVYEMTK
jgi:beta-glucanase (GH16 family)